jgi:hypothetical protein
VVFHDAGRKDLDNNEYEGDAVHERNRGRREPRHSIVQTGSVPRKGWTTVSYDNQPEAVDTATDALETTETGADENLGDGALTNPATDDAEGGTSTRKYY